MTCENLMHRTKKDAQWLSPFADAWSNRYQPHTTPDRLGCLPSSRCAYFFEASKWMYDWRKNLRTGRRHENGKKNANWGGSWKKKNQIDYSPPDDDVHGDLKEVVRDSNERSVMKSHSDASTVTLVPSTFCEVECTSIHTMPLDNSETKNNESEILAIAEIVEI